LLTDGSIRSNIFRSIIHRDFDHETFENDIALLMLDTQIRFSSSVLPICLPNVGVSLQGFAIAVGFGGTDTNREGSAILQEVEIPIVDNIECLANDSEFYEKFLNHGNFCAGKKGVVKNVCGGDEGKKQ
jgi:secreted trypsin-like serine protease